jgi:hypothetical protein
MHAILGAQAHDIQKPVTNSFIVADAFCSIGGPMTGQQNGILELGYLPNGLLCLVDIHAHGLPGKARNSFIVGHKSVAHKESPAGKIETDAARGVPGSMYHSQIINDV